MVVEAVRLWSRPIPTCRQYNRQRTIYRCVYACVCVLLFIICIYSEFSTVVDHLDSLGINVLSLVGVRNVSRSINRGVWGEFFIGGSQRGARSKLTPRGGFRHVQHVRPNRGLHKKGPAQEDRQILQHSDMPEIKLK